MFRLDGDTQLAYSEHELQHGSGSRAIVVISTSDEFIVLVSSPVWVVYYLNICEANEASY
jgi:hypothetical protein